MSEPDNSERVELRLEDLEAAIAKALATPATPRNRWTSRKFLATVLGVAVVALNDYLALNLTVEQQAMIIAAILGWVTVEGANDFKAQQQNGSK